MYIYAIFVLSICSDSLANRCSPIGQNQSGALLFSLGNHDLPPISIPCHLQLICLSAYISHFVNSSNIFSCFFFLPCCILLQSFQLSQDVPPVPVSLLITWQRKVAWCLCILIVSDLLGCLCILIMTDLLGQLFETLIRLISLQSMRLIAFCDV